MRSWWVAAVMAVVLLLGAAGAQAAEVLQVRSGTLLQVGDHNRTYTVELDEAAAAWLRQQLPRRTRVNLRPLGNREGTLLARVQRLEGGGNAATDLGDGLISAGLASALPECAA